jgi:hypothetical protein
MVINERTTPVSEMTHEEAVARARALAPAIRERAALVPGILACLLCSQKSLLTPGADHYLNYCERTILPLLSEAQDMQRMQTEASCRRREPVIMSILPTPW